MIIKKILLAAVLAIAAQTAFSQNSEDNPIDKRLKACLDSSQNQTTYGMIGCEAEAERAWDGELNKYYKLLMGQLTEDEKAKLKASQIKWLAYRDAEFTTLNTIYTDMQGTMWRPVAVDSEVQIIKHRALELKAYYDNLNEGK